MKKLIIIVILFMGLSVVQAMEDYSDAQIVSINTNTVSAKFENGKIYRVINTSQPFSVQLRKNFRGKWKRKKIYGGQALDLLIRRGYFVTVKNRGITYYAATKSYRTLADPPHKYNHTAKLNPTFQYYYPVTTGTRDCLPANDIRHYNYYSPTQDRWHSVPYYNSSYPWYRDSIISEHLYRRSGVYPPGYYGHPYSRW